MQYLPYHSSTCTCIVYTLLHSVRMYVCMLYWIGYCFLLRLQDEHFRTTPLEKNVSQLHILLVCSVLCGLPTSYVVVSTYNLNIMCCSMIKWCISCAVPGGGIIFGVGGTKWPPWNPLKKIMYWTNICQQYLCVPKQPVLAYGILTLWFQLCDDIMLVVPQVLYYNLSYL